MDARYPEIVDRLVARRLQLASTEPCRRCRQIDETRGWKRADDA
jgi:hypothetical protein